MQAQSLARGSSTPRAEGNLRARFHSLLVLCLWITTLPRSSDTLAPPPHERVCPGPLDEGNSALCQASGKAQFEVGALLVRLADGNVVIKAKRVEGFFGVGMAEFVTVDGTAWASANAHAPDDAPGDRCVSGNSNYLASSGGSHTVTGCDLRVLARCP